MSTNSIIRRPRELAGTFSIRKEGRGSRRVRILVFTSHDGYVGESRTWSHEDAYRAAVAKRLAALQASARATASNQKPAPVAQLVQTMHESVLMAELERRGYEIHVAETVEEASR